MKILVIFGSPRKKNSYLVTKVLEAELKEREEFEFEYIFLKELSLAYCIGCHNCLFYGEEKCPLPDNMKIILNKMLAADGLIFVSPVYVSQVTGLMKNFIDRFSFLCHRPQLFKQDLLVISTTGVMGLKSVLDYLANTAKTWGIRSVTKLGIITPPDKTEEDIKTDKFIIKAATKYYKKLSKKKWTPTLSQVIQFNAQKAFLTTSKAKKHSPKDFQHYQKLQNKKYYVPAQISLFKLLTGWIVGKFVKLTA